MTVTLGDQIHEAPPRAGWNIPPTISGNFLLTDSRSLDSTEIRRARTTRARPRAALIRPRSHQRRPAAAGHFGIGSPRLIAPDGSRIRFSRAHRSGRPLNRVQPGTPHRAALESGSAGHTAAAGP